MFRNQHVRLGIEYELAAFVNKKVEELEVLRRRLDLHNGSDQITSREITLRQQELLGAQQRFTEFLDGLRESYAGNASDSAWVLLEFFKAVKT